ncbi:DNA-binding transcriptional regulator, MarR family [Paractinoplanes atraurantiacus]|uniref:DNA-binding transcriptional regulator, MarR family n=1 Tax=Paractinoplanes atraurantiacus TaxID=1036182 RepID=A0A285KS03_9ACTN|nr:DNA-binding transcriptional regulator, MarR family [Actinoplanes atraurantiacus]
MELAEALRVAIGDFVRRARAGDRMPAGQAAVLGHLDRAGAVSIAELARREQVRHQSMTRTVHLLHDQGFVALKPHETDRRQVVVEISDEGRAALAGERRHRAAGIAEAIQHDLDEGEREVVRRIPEILAKLQPRQ